LWEISPFSAFAVVFLALVVMSSVMVVAAAVVICPKVVGLASTVVATHAAPASSPVKAHDGSLVQESLG